MISQVDMHVHSTYSGLSPDWYLRMLQSHESYTDIKQVFLRAIKRGKTFVTITDHDQVEGSLRLKEIFPERVFSGAEYNVYFPEDHCKVHILVYGQDEKQHRDLMSVREDIYQFRDYIRHHQMAYSVAHALLAMDDKLNRTHLEKLILLFDVFEGINGSQLQVQNQAWVDTLRALTPESIDILFRRYHIDPISSDPWVKGFTGGSDDHADLFIGRTYTEARADTVDGFLDALRRKKTTASGSHSTIKDLSMSVIKMAYELGSRKSGHGFTVSLLRDTSAHVFEGYSISLKSRAQLGLLKMVNRFQPNPLRNLATRLLTSLAGEDFSDEGERAGKLYNCLMQISDEALVNIIRSFNWLDCFKIDSSLEQIKSYLASLALCLPFYASLGFMHASHRLIKDFRLDENGLTSTPRTQKRALWFVDDDSMADFAGGLVDLDVVFVSDRPIIGVLPQKQVLLETLAQIRIGQEKNRLIHIPSILKSLDLLAELQPDEIIISTSSPVGMIGFMLSRFLNLSCSGFFFDNSLSWVSQNELSSRIFELLEQYNNWFFDQLTWLEITPNRETAANQMALAEP